MGNQATASVCVCRLPDAAEVLFWLRMRLYAFCDAVHGEGMERNSLLNNVPKICSKISSLIMKWKLF